MVLFNSQNLKNINEKYIGNGIKIIGSGYTGRLELGEIINLKKKEGIWEFYDEERNWQKRLIMLLRGKLFIEIIE